MTDKNMADNVKLVGSINVAKMKNVGVMTIQGVSCAKKCLVIPIEENDIFVKVESKTTREGQSYLDKKFCIGIEVYEGREKDQYGNTHYVKLATSKDYVNTHTQEDVDARNHTYLGNLKPIAIPSSNQASTIEAPVAQIAPAEDDDLPF